MRLFNSDILAVLQPIKIRNDKFNNMMNVCFTIIYNGFVYGKLRFCVRGFSEGKSDVTKQATTFI
ncbi:MAG: hypothetical protein CL525_00225 [Aequorivita sp.]|nr:hypothetical protein [Aequorivita sp.]MBF29549.1 hypothetical protein [Aequorivita sp.]